MFRIYLYIIIIGVILTGITTFMTPIDNYIKIYSQFSTMKVDELVKVSKDLI